MMNQEDIFRKIGQILNELQDQYDFLAQNPQQLNELELELFLANANFLSDHVEIVRKINNNKIQKELPEPVKSDRAIAETHVLPAAEAKTMLTEISSVQEQQAPEVGLQMEQIELEELHQEDLDGPEFERPSFEFILKEEPLSDKFEFEEKSINEIFDRPLSEEEQRIIADKQKQTESLPMDAPSITPEPVSAHIQAVPPAPIVAQVEATFPEDKIEEKVVLQPSSPPNTARPTLNDLLAAKNSGTPSFNEGNHKPAVTDLKGGISLNEKLLYIKDLFNGYNLAYSEAIDLINKMPDLKTADVFLQKNYAEKNNWASKQSTVDRFYALLAQRFPEG